MNSNCKRSWSRREWMAGTAGTAALAVPQILRAAASPASSVAIVRCTDYRDFGARLETGLDRIGGIGHIVKGKTVGVKLNFTGAPDRFPSTHALPFRTDPQSVLQFVHILAKNGARRVRLIESFFPAEQDLSLWARYGLDVNAINNAGVPVVWENTQNLGRYKQYVRLKVPFGGYMYPAYYLNQAYVDCDSYISLAKMKNHAINGVTLSSKNNFGNTPCSLYGGDCGPKGNEHPTEVRARVLHQGRTKAPSGVDAELHPDSPRVPGYRVPRVVVDQIAIRPVDLAIIDGVETVRGGEGPWIPGLQKMTPGVIVVGKNCVSTDAVAAAVMGYDPRANHTGIFSHCDNHLLLAEAVGLGSADLNRIEVVGAKISHVRTGFGLPAQRA